MKDKDFLAEAGRLQIPIEPTRGVDIGAKSEIYALTHELAAAGAAVDAGDAAVEIVDQPDLGQEAVRGGDRAVGETGRRGELHGAGRVVDDDGLEARIGLELRCDLPGVLDVELVGPGIESVLPLGEALCLLP